MCRHVSLLCWFLLLLCCRTCAGEGARVVLAGHGGASAAAQRWAELQSVSATATEGHRRRFRPRTSAPKGVCVIPNQNLSNCLQPASAPGSLSNANASKYIQEEHAVFIPNCSLQTLQQGIPCSAQQVPQRSCASDGGVLNPSLLALAAVLACAPRCFHRAESLVCWIVAAPKSQTLPLAQRGCLQALKMNGEIKEWAGAFKDRSHLEWAVCEPFKLLPVAQSCFYFFPMTPIPPLKEKKISLPHLTKWELFLCALVISLWSFTSCLSTKSVCVILFRLWMIANLLNSSNKRQNEWNGNYWNHWATCGFSQLWSVLPHKILHFDLYKWNSKYQIIYHNVHIDKT